MIPCHGDDRSGAERLRLAEFYSGQMDGELEQVAGQAYELTELAREALSAELGRRGLQTKLIETAPVVFKKQVPVMPGDPPPPAPPAPPSAPDGELELRKMVPIRQFRDLPEALLAKGSLESAGIEAVLTDDNVVRMDWFWSNLMGGSSCLWVRKMPRKRMRSWPSPSPNTLTFRA